MPPIVKKESGLVKRDLSDIILLKNTRTNYENDDSIIGLAETIKARGQLQPVIINKKNELKAGYRRYYAHKLLVSNGEPFNQIECIIRRGDFLIDNLIENIQREQLEAGDLEAAVQLLIDEGYSQTEAAKLIGKPKTWISDILAAKKTRLRIEDLGISTEKITTSALSLLRSIDDSDMKEIIDSIKSQGGTVKATREAVKSKKSSKAKPAPKPTFYKIEKEFEKLVGAGISKEEIIKHLGGKEWN